MRCSVSWWTCTKRSACISINLMGLDKKIHQTINYGLACFVCVLGIISLVMSYHAMNVVTQEPDAYPAKPIYVVDEAYGLWRYVCEQDEGGYNACYAYQKVNGFKDGSALVVKISLTKRQGQVLPRLKIISPFETFLPAGVTIDLAVQEPFTVPFQFCSVEEEGCFINLDLADDVVAALVQENALNVTYKTMHREESRNVVHLDGLSELLERLKKSAYWPVK